MNYTGYEHVKVTEPDNMAVEYKLTASEPNANLQVASQSVGSVQDGSAMDRRATGMLAVIQDMRGVRDSLPPRPPLEAVMTAHKEVSALDKDLIRQLAETANIKRPYVVEPAWFEHLQLMREDRCRRDLSYQKRPLEAVLELDEFYRHYDDIIMQAERGVVGGVLNSDGTGVHAYVPPVRPRVLNTMFGETSLRADSAVGFSTSDQTGGTRVTSTAVATPVLLPVTIRNPVVTRAIGGGTLTPEVSPGQAAAPQGLLLSALTGPSLATQTSITRATSGGLESISEGSTTHQLPSHLTALLEDAAEDGRQTLSLKAFPNGPLKWLPHSICNLDCLTELDLRANQLMALPPGIGQLSTLRSLLVNNNKLVDLPHSLGLLKNLTVFDFSGNKVEELPVSIGLCTNLITLRAEFNSLKALPEDTGNLIHLQTLTIHLNQLKRLPRTIGGLECLTFLDAHYNQIEHVPDGICRLTNLTFLNLSAQHFSLQEIPWAIGNLDQLLELDLSQNHLKVLPDSIVNLTRLKKLRLDGNPLQIPPRQVAAKGKDAVMDFFKTKSDADSASKDLKQKASKRSIFGKLLPSHPLGSASNLLPSSKIFSSRFLLGTKSLPGGSGLSSPDRG